MILIKTKEYLMEAAQVGDPLTYGLLKSAKYQRVELEMCPDLFYKINFLTISSKQTFCSYRYA
jgi:hypothetical protein